MDQRNNFDKGSMEYLYLACFATGVGLYLGYQGLNFKAAPSK